MFGTRFLQVQKLEEDASFKHSGRSKKEGEGGGWGKDGREDSRKIGTEDSPGFPYLAKVRV